MNQLNPSMCAVFKIEKRRTELNCNKVAKESTTVFRNWLGEKIELIQLANFRDNR